MPTPIAFKDFGLARLAIPVARVSPQVFANAPIAAPVARPAVAVTAGPELRRAAFNDFRIDRVPIRIQPAPPAAPGHDRAATSRPIADVTDPVDTTLFVNAAGTMSWYLPRYRLKLDSNRYDIAMTDAPEGGFRLSLGFERFAAPELADAAGAKELPHDLAAGIEYLSVSRVPKTVALTDLLMDGTTVVGASARLTLMERDSFITALKRNGIQLVFRRAIKVSALLATGGGQPVVQFIAHDAMKPQLLMALRSDAMVSKQPPARRLRPSIRPDGGLRPDFAPPEPAAPTPAPSRPSLPRYNDVDLILEQARDPEPLILDESLHGYFYQNGPRAEAGGALVRLSVPHDDGTGERHHSYFQDGEDRSLFYYLPDAVRLARARTEPFLPEMKVRIQSPDGSIAAAQATIDYAARPCTLPARLVEAIGTLARAIPATLATGDGQRPVPRLQPMPGAITLKMRVPGASGVEMRAFNDASGDLANGVTHSMTLPLDQFRQLFAAGFTRDATSLFTGQAIVAVGTAGVEAVPVDIRFGDTEGPLFDSVETTGADGVVAVTLRNAIESPLRIRHLPTRLLRAGVDIAGRIEGLDLAQPVDVAPGESISFRINPSTSLAGEGAADAVFDFADVDILAQPDLVLPVISDTTVPAEYVRAIEVMAIPELLDADNPDGPILLINVEFETGAPVKITRDAATAIAAVRLPLMNMLLGKDTKGSYGFRQQIIRRSGAQTRDDDWRRSDFGVLVVPAR